MRGPRGALETLVISKVTREPSFTSDGRTIIFRDAVCDWSNGMNIQGRWHFGDELKRAKRTSLVVLALAITFTLVVTAQRSTAGYYIYGNGKQSCGTWVQNKEKDTASRVTLYDGQKAWVVGFVSGAGYWRSGPDLQATDVGGIVTFMDTYCQAHPLNLIATGAAALADQLAANSAKALR